MFLAIVNISKFVFLHLHSRLRVYFLRECVLLLYHGTERFPLTFFNLMGATTAKSANSFKKSVYGPGSVYTVARARDGRYLFCVSDSVTLSRSILNELNLYPAAAG